MASPQKENGYTPIANELLEALCSLEISGACFRVMWVIVRKTYGYQKKIDTISLSQFEKITGMYRPTIIDAMDTLEQMKIIKIDRSNFINGYKLNKNYEEWTSNQNRTSSQNHTSRVLPKTSSQKHTKTSSQNPTYKRNKENTKETCETVVSRSPLKVKKKDMGWKQYNENAHSDELPSIGDDGEIIKEERKKHVCYEVYAVFKEITGVYPLFWNKNRSQRIACENLMKERGIEQIKKALEYYMENKEDKWCPKILSPWDLDTKWKKLYTFKEEHG